MVRELTTKRFLRGCLAMVEFRSTFDAFLALNRFGEMRGKPRSRAFVKNIYMVASGL
jgi:hypothetical protein